MLTQKLLILFDQTQSIYQKSSLTISTIVRKNNKKIFIGEKARINIKFFGEKRK